MKKIEIDINAGGTGTVRIDGELLQNVVAIRFLVDAHDREPQLWVQLIGDVAIRAESAVVQIEQPAKP